MRLADLAVLAGLLVVDVVLQNAMGIFLNPGGSHNLIVLQSTEGGASCFLALSLVSCIHGILDRLEAIHVLRAHQTDFRSIDKQIPGCPTLGNAGDDAPPTDLV